MQQGKRRIILHVGSPKCGSTYLQRVLLGNAELLETHGIRYPKPPGAHPGNAGALEQITRPEVEEMLAGGIHTLLLSHEDLYAVPHRGAGLRTIADALGLELQVVAFLRPISAFIFSDYSQFMKQFFETYLQSRTPYDGRDFEAFASYRLSLIKPATYLKKWEQLAHRPLILARHLEIRPVYERLLGPGPELDWHVPRVETNPSLRVEDCERIAEAMRDPARDDEEIRAMFRDAFHKTGQPDAGRSPRRVARIERMFARQNRELKKAFGFDNSPAASGRPPTR